ncbi:MAG: hypothetical protein JXL97_18790 [Bacteroidales bacterium]|nr:hypothetical protein [Bacteroidales bacterium]
MIKYFLNIITFAFLFVACNEIQTETSKVNFAENHTFQNKKIEKSIKKPDKFTCKNLSYQVFPAEDEAWAKKMIVFKDYQPIDTIYFDQEKVYMFYKEENAVLFADLDFDGNCDIVIHDVASASHGTMNHFFYLFNEDSQKFLENYSLPKLNGGVFPNSENQTVVVYCSYHDCEAVYKFIDGIFVLVEGEFTMEP